MAATRLIAMHQNKGKTVAQCLYDRTEYAKNGEKTERGEWISSYECNAEIADKEFLIARAEYLKDHHERKGDIIAYQIRQSFKPGEVTPEEANAVGYETAMRFTKGKHAFFVATHVDRAHIHNHIIFNSIDLKNERKFRNFLFSGIALGKVSDLVCLEHGLSVIKPRRPSERARRTTYEHRKTFRAFIREDIDEILAKQPKEFDEFLQMLMEKEYEIKRGKNIAIRGKGQKRYIRFKSLGKGYAEADLKKIILGEELKPGKEPEQVQGTGRDFDLLLNIQDIIAQGKGAGYERWAKVYNIKQVSRALLFLQEHDCRDYEELVKRADETSNKFAELTKGIKAAEARMSEIAVLRTHIKNYAKTKEIYIKYRKTGCSEKYFEAHRQELTLHKAARDAFAAYGDKKIPSMKELSIEYDEVLAKKKALYSEYRTAKEEMKKYQTAKYDIDKILNMDLEGNRKKEERQKKRETSL